jgi:2-polyprenyl-6-methoxyphenol hydroxylase-like FAD-dependent oxidoreductase
VLCLIAAMGQEKVAVVGSGMAGLATAWALHNDPSKKFDVTVFEKVLSTEPAHCDRIELLNESRATHVRSTGTRMHQRIHRFPASIFPCASSLASTTPTCLDL